MSERRMFSPDPNLPRRILALPEERERLAIMIATEKGEEIARGLVACPCCVSCCVCV